MKIFLRLLLLSMASLWLTPVQSAPQLDQCTGGSLGAPYRGVQAYSNAPYQGKTTSCGGDADINRGTYGYAYQCVEFVRRFYATNNGPNTGNANNSWPKANAADLWDYPTAMGLKRFANGGTERPRPDDILVFGPKAIGDVGHVAIVVAVTNTSIQVVEQNWSSTGYATISAQVRADGTYFVPNRGSYPIRGWMGKRTTSATTYIGHRTVGSGSAYLSITTDGTIGILSRINIVDWRITVRNGGDTATILGPLSGNNSALGIAGSGLTATASDLRFNFDYSAVGYSYALFQGNGASWFYCVDTLGCGGRGESLMAVVNYDQSKVTSTPHSGVQVIATRP